MDTVLQLIYLLIPAVLVFFTALIFFRRMQDDQRKFQRLLIRMEERKQSLPLQLKAYERLIIMLERITPGPMVMRLNAVGKNGAQLQLEMLKQIREEFEHNISMQMYVSQTAWEMTKMAKDETSQLINIAATKAGSDATALAFSKEVFALEETTANQSIKQALALLRDEARRMM